MKTKTIFKTLAAAMLMPAMLLTTACSNNDDEIVNTENPTSTKGYALPVTINVTRQGDAATRATYDGETKKLSFSTGDKLLVNGTYSEGDYSGVLTWQSEGEFSGVILTQKKYSGTADDLLSSDDVYATLLPAGYESYGCLSIEEEGTCTARVHYDWSKAYALTKAAAVEQFSDECAYSYDNGFALSPQNAIVSFTISGLAANKEVEVLFKVNDDKSATPVNVTTDATGVATFASAMSMFYMNFNNYSLTVDDNAIALPANKTVEAGKIYNISRSVAPVALSAVTADYTAQNGDILTGTLGSNVKISIANGASVTLKDVTINGENNDSYKWAGITCLGDATITLEGTNTVKGFDEDYPGIHVPEGKTLTIQGEGSLNASGNGLSAGIGGGRNMHCGNIVINGGNITATGGEYNAGIGGGDSGSCGAITISGGTVTATGGDCAAGIGSGDSGSCGAITISGGTVTATGGQYAAGIGGGSDNKTCGTITIKSTVTEVTATKGKVAPNSIGSGDKGKGITVTIEDGANVTQE